jgi:outer membrane lipoprotein LolB
MAAWRPWIALLALALGACATPPTAPPERTYAGRFAAIAVNGAQRESVSGRFLIEVRGDRKTIDLATPVGTTIARIEIEPGRASATGPQLQTVTGPDADELVERLLGWSLPVAGLVDWINGQPVPSRPARTRREGDRIAEIEQDGWMIRIGEYSPITARPSRLVMDRARTATDPAVSVRVIVDDPTP